MDGTMSNFDEQACRVCGCTDDDCSGCVERTGVPCHWVDWDLCSACDVRRVQLSRRRGWRMPANTVSVARPSRWGNPFRVGALLPLGEVVYEIRDADDAVRLYANWLSNTVDEHGRYVDGQTTYFGVESFLRPSHDEIRRELAGRSLACWCKLGTPCHAVVLLAIANGAVA